MQEKVELKKKEEDKLTHKNGKLRRNNERRSERLKGRNALKSKQGRKARKPSDLGVNTGREPEGHLHPHPHPHPHLTQKIMLVTQSAQAVIPTEVWIGWLVTYAVPGTTRNAQTYLQKSMTL